MNKEVIQITREFLPNMEPSSVKIRELKVGLINNTFRVDLQHESYILQRINTSIFRNPELIHKNHAHIRAHLLAKGYPKEVLQFICSNNGEELLSKDKEKWRMSRYIDGENVTSVKSLEMSRNAAASLAEFHYYLRDIHCDKIEDPIPEFCNFSYRIREFENAVQNGDKNRKNHSKELIEKLRSLLPSLQEYISTINSLPNRVIHGDPKISNFLFLRGSTTVLSLIDLDTLMNGTICYDFGDMVRSFANTSHEDENSEQKKLDPLVYEETLSGYLGIGKQFLSKEEISCLPIAALGIPLIQSMRFLSDYLNMDAYYQVSNPDQNLNRAYNQYVFFKELKDYLNL